MLDYYECPSLFFHFNLLGELDRVEVCGGMQADFTTRIFNLYLCLKSQLQFCSFYFSSCRSTSVHPGSIGSFDYNLPSSCP